MVVTMATMIISFFLVLIINRSSSMEVQCACASIDTNVYSDHVNGNILHTLEAPNCLPLIKSDEDDKNSTYVKVSYDKPAWLRAVDVYVRNCDESFGCVCTVENETVFQNPDVKSLPLRTLISDRCFPTKGRVQVCYGDIWIPVDLGSEIGWLKKGNVTFHPSCETGAGCPRIISRDEWGARDSKNGLTRMKKAPGYAVVHHSATEGCRTRSECVTRVRSFQKTHMDVRGWNDIGYNFMVGEDGSVYEGRGWDSVGAHITWRCNSISLGFAVIGDFREIAPRPKALDALRSLLTCGVKMGKLDPSYKLFGRRDFTVAPSPISPGQKLYDIITTWDHYNRTEICV